MTITGLKTTHELRNEVPGLNSRELRNEAGRRRLQVKRLESAIDQAIETLARPDRTQRLDRLLQFLRKVRSGA